MVGITIWCCFAVFSFYRFYHIFAVVEPFKRAFIDRETQLRERGVSPNWKGHFVATIIYFGGFPLLIFDLCDYNIHNLSLYAQSFLPDLITMEGIWDLITIVTLILFLIVKIGFLIYKFVKKRGG